MRAFETTIGVSMAAAETATRNALSKHGFGVLTEIDVAATLADKLGVERPALKILGACNPAFAHRSLELDPSAALLLPCNVVLADAGEDRTRVSIVDPRALLSTLDGAQPDDLKELASEAAHALEVALAELQT